MSSWKRSTQAKIKRGKKKAHKVQLNAHWKLEASEEELKFPVKQMPYVYRKARFYLQSILVAISLTAVLSTVSVTEIWMFLKENHEKIECEKRDHRGVYTVIYLGWWTTPGGKTHDKLYLTEESLSETGQALINKLTKLGEQVSEYVEKYFPTEAAEMQQIPKKFRPFGLFSLAVCNTTCSTTFHLDKRDEYLCAVIPLGKFTGGFLAFSEFDIAFDLQVCDIGIFFGRFMYHQAQAFEGERMSIVFSVKLNTLKNALRMEKIPLNTLTTSYHKISRNELKQAVTEKRKDLKEAQKKKKQQQKEKSLK